MNMQLFYNPDIDKNTQQITFDKVESRHIVKVLRKKVGDTVYITDGKGCLYTSKINIANDKKCLATIPRRSITSKPQDLSMHIAPPKWFAYIRSVYSGTKEWAAPTPKEAHLLDGSAFLGPWIPTIVSIALL